jgi:uncharacterized protein YecE (DUF72 family)
MSAKRLWIGTSGWSYDGWKTAFYAGVPRRQWLRHYAEHFDGVEVNMTFYRTPRTAVLEKWRDETPADFGFAIKAWRGITHLKRLHDAGDSVRKERDNLSPLMAKISAVLWQLPAGLHCDLDLLKKFAGVLADWPEVPHAIEFRHTSWFEDEVLHCLEDAGLANVISHAARWPIWDAVSGDLVYLRLHGAPQTYASGYSDEELESWAARMLQWLADGRLIHAYFDNDALGHAPYDAMNLRDKVLGTTDK